jgi:hypothetical protein
MKGSLSKNAMKGNNMLIISFIAEKGIMYKRGIQDPVYH